MNSHYAGLFAGYGVTSALVWLFWASNRIPALRLPAIDIARPWVEIGMLVAAVAGVIAIGQAYTAGLMLDSANVGLECLNQLAIYSPILVVLALRPNPFSSAFLARAGVLGLPIGLLGAGLAITAYAFTRGQTDALAPFARFLADPKHLPHGLQVLLQDIAIAAFLCRLSAAVGRAPATGTVAALFALSHAPAMIANGATLASLRSLVLDSALGVLVMGAIIVTRSIWWFVPVHLIMDMTQLYSAFSAT